MANRHKNRYHNLKLRGSHTTFAEGMGKLVKILDHEPAVESFTLGFITTRPGKGSYGRLAVRIFRERGNLLLKASKSSAFQEFRVFGNNINRLAKNLERRFQEKGIEIKA